MTKCKHCGNEIEHNGPFWADMSKPLNRYYCMNSPLEQGKNHEPAEEPKMVCKFCGRKVVKKCGMFFDEAVMIMPPYTKTYGVYCIASPLHKHDISYEETLEVDKEKTDFDNFVEMLTKAKTLFIIDNKQGDYKAVVIKTRNTSITFLFDTNGRYHKMFTIIHIDQYYTEGPIS